MRAVLRKLDQVTRTQARWNRGSVWLGEAETTVQILTTMHAKLFHRIYFTICLSLNRKILFEDKNKKQMEVVRSNVMENLPAWVEELQKIAESELHLEDPSKTCTKLLSSIITKVFNARSNTLLKRYQSTHLARGQSKAVRSAFREDMKHASRKGKKRSRNT